MRHASKSAAGITVVVYSRPNCPLCQNAVRVSQNVYGRARVKEIDITGNPALEEPFALRIPVVAINGQVVAEGDISEADLRPRRPGHGWIRKLLEFR